MLDAVPETMGPQTPSDTTQWEGSHDSNCSDTDGPPRRPRAVDRVMHDNYAASVNSGASARDAVAATVEAMTPPAPLVAPTALFGLASG